jgi:folate-binding Fe-S cluster repair protein YgfZ
VSLTKGCYVGQETLARLATYDGVKQQLRRWFMPASPQAGATAPGPGSTLRDAEGQRAGQVTSALALPGGEGWIGLALVRRGCLAAPQLHAGEGSGAIALTISVPPGYAAPPVGAGGGS